MGGATQENVQNVGPWVGAAIAAVLVVYHVCAAKAVEWNRSEIRKQVVDKLGGFELNRIYTGDARGGDAK